MSIAATYAILKQDIQDWLENDASEFTDEIDTFIDLGELRVHKDADLAIFRGTDTATATAGNHTITIPTTDEVIAIRDVRSLPSGGTTVGLIQKDESFIREFWPVAATQGTPRFWAPLDTVSILIAPAANASTTLTFYYTKRLSPLSASNTTNYLTTDCYDALLYACLIEAAAFNKNEDVDHTIFNTKYQEAIGRMLAEEKRINTDRVRRRS